MTDYAAELLGGRKPEPAAPVAPQPSGGTDYASQLLGGKTVQPSVMRPVEQESSGAPFGTMVKAAMVDEPQTKMRIYARARFPQLSEKDALDRYGVMNGEIVYLDADGKIKKESPSGLGGFFKELGASMIGQAPSVIGGTVGAIAGAPAGPVGAAGGAVLGAAGGKGISQVIANTVYDEPQTVGGNSAGMALEGATNAAFTYAGSKLSKAIAERALARDISKLNRTDADALIAKARGMGIDLNAAQASNLPSLKGRYEVLGRFEPSMDIIDASRVSQGNQAADAAGSFMGLISPASGSPQVAGANARTGAEKILGRIAEDRSTAARPLYEKALSQVIPNTEELSSIANVDQFKKAVERGMKIAAAERSPLTEIQDATGAWSMRGLHYAKLGLDEMIGNARQEGIGSVERGALIQLKNALLKEMDTAAPTYARARSVYGHFMPTLKANRDGFLGAIADMGDTDLNKVAKDVFNASNSPEDIRKLRSMFFRYDQGDKWNGMLKSFMQDTFENAGREFKSGAGGIRGQAASWRAAMAGNPKQLEVMRASMTEPQFKGFVDMMEVFSALGRVTGQGGSPTMPLMEAAKQMRGEAMGVIPKALQPRQTVIDWLTEARLGKHAEEMARVMTSPDGLKQLKQLRQLSPTDQKFIAGFSSLFGIGKQSDESAVDQPITAQQ